MKFRTYATILALVALPSAFGGGLVGRYKFPYIDPVLKEKAKICEINGEHAITRVVDGDSMIIKFCGHDEELRLIGVNTPETHGKHQCFGPEASQRANDLLLDKKVRLETDSSQSKNGRDMHGRLLVYVYLPDGKNYGEYMIAEGFAHEELYQKHYKYEPEFKAAYQKAKDAKKGMWHNPTCAEESEKTTVRMRERRKK